jgi:hypothetical protein
MVVPPSPHRLPATLLRRPQRRCWLQCSQAGNKWARCDRVTSQRW